MIQWTNPLYTTIYSIKPDKTWTPYDNFSSISNVIFLTGYYFLVVFFYFFYFTIFPVVLMVIVSYCSNAEINVLLLELHKNIVLWNQNLTSLFNDLQKLLESLLLKIS